MASIQQKAWAGALEWYIDHGVDEALTDNPVNRLAGPQKNTEPASAPPPVSVQPLTRPPIQLSEAPSMLGMSDARSEAVKLAAAASTLEELRAAIATFDGLAIRKTATNMVFSDGNPDSPVMLVGEAPGADEDRMGKPFVGVSGQLLDRIFACIGMSRAAEDSKDALYISNILNWRPPGNRTPSPAEVEVSLPFIEKHIQLVKPKLLILCGGVSAKALLGSGDSVSKLRKTWHDYRPLTADISHNSVTIPTIVTYHPAYLLRTPGQKKAVWADMLTLDAKRAALGLK